jgi:hypothetical protein
MSRTTSECREREHVFNSITIEDCSWSEPANNWVACPEQPCPNRYVQGIDADSESWFQEFRAPNHEQVAQIQERQRQNAQPFPASNPTVSIALRSPSPPSCPPSPFLQPAAVVSPRPVRTTQSAVVSDFFWDLLSDHLPAPPTQ